SAYYLYTATVLAIQASVSICKSGLISCRYEILLSEKLYVDVTLYKCHLGAGLEWFWGRSQLCPLAEIG
ncbi:MAG: hypothetical protein KDE58_26740, partial [Caldilineaceae bacterium]|nr:hypothetical protein [Caldilineaceae bacterium]